MKTTQMVEWSNGQAIGMESTEYFISAEKKLCGEKVRAFGSSRMYRCVVSTQGRKDFLEEARVEAAYSSSSLPLRNVPLGLAEYATINDND
jgi:hypothetical protein